MVRTQTDSKERPQDSVKKIQAKNCGLISEATKSKRGDWQEKSGLVKKDAALAEGAAQVGSRITKEEGRNHWVFAASLSCHVKLHLPSQSGGPSREHPP